MSLIQSARMNGHDPYVYLKDVLTRLRLEQLLTSAFFHRYPTGVHVSEFEVDLNSLSAAEETQVVARIQQILASFPSLTTSVNTFLTERVDESISGVTAPVVINVFGSDLDVLDSIAQEIAQVIGRIPGAIGLRVEST
jgi:Cu/Ag efflux pump CusA